MTAVIAIINYNGKILIGKKKSDSLKSLTGEWHIPGETKKEGETDMDAIVRGMSEETGLEIRVGRSLASHITPTSKSTVVWYECFSDTDKVRTGSDLEELKWVEKNKVMEYCHKRHNLWPKEIIDYFFH